jgi:hypothetical protein
MAGSAAAAIYLQLTGVHGFSGFDPRAGIDMEGYYDYNG